VHRHRIELYTSFNESIVIFQNIGLKALSWYNDAVAIFVQPDQLFYLTHGSRFSGHQDLMFGDDPK
jgi:hypothetical protein